MRDQGFGVRGLRLSAGHFGFRPIGSPFGRRGAAFKAAISSGAAAMAENPKQCGATIRVIRMVVAQHLGLFLGLHRYGERCEGGTPRGLTIWAMLTKEEDYRDPARAAAA
ncbi:hypothetical protein VQ042_14845 [Aurantimonas sp. A2-1-M11]|uniref:hypothetical protein n=1 Tax=Aurantimonas sp. A2-1-M11 TaxID=3113712 RepID=UPI002F9246F3